MKNWQCVATRLVGAELKKRGMTYAELAAQLQAVGVVQNENTLRSKINKGTFGAALLLAIFHVIKADINPMELGVILQGCENKIKK